MMQVKVDIENTFELLLESQDAQYNIIDIAVPR